MDVDKTGFSPKFEEKIVQAILSDTNFAEQIYEVLDPNLLDLPHTKELSRTIKKYHQKYECFPTVSLLESICEQEIKNPILQRSCADYIERIKSMPLNGDSQYVKDESLMFFRTQAVKHALLDEVLPQIKRKNLEEILPIIERAINLGSSRDIGYHYKSDQEERFIVDPQAKVPSGFLYMDALLGGGWEGKRLITVIGGSGAGKSHFMVAAGCGALMAGKVVIHYTLELSWTDVARRYDANLTNVDINHVPNHKDKILQTLKSKLPEDSDLIIKEYPMMSASIQTIKAHLARLRLRGIIPDLIIIDYGDLLADMERHTEERFRTASHWVGMKRLAQEMGLPVLTCTQSNRKGYNEEILLPEHVSEDFKKIMHSDVIVTMARNMEQKIKGIGKMLMAKNRQDEDGQIWDYKLNTRRSQIEMFEITEEGEIENAMRHALQDDFSRIDKYIKAIK